MIDIHTHVLHGWGKNPFTETHLVRRMEELDIDRFVVLPIIGPEVPYHYFGTEDVLEVYKRHPEKVIPFCNIDPRAGKNSPATDFSPLLYRYREAGCKGLGELTANIYIDDPMCINLFRQCGEFELPVLFHLFDRFGGSYGLVDDKKLPRLEKVLAECPGTKFIGHAPSFWSEISRDVDDRKRSGYPREPVKSPGRLQELFDNYPNLFGDISAGSGYNALTRDAAYGYEFMEKYRDRLLFGTDILKEGQSLPVVNYIREALRKKRISKTAYSKIAEENAVKLLCL